MHKRAAYLFNIILLAIASVSIPIDPTFATPAQSVSVPYQTRTVELLEILKGAEKETEFFASSFIDAVPVPQFRSLTAQLKAQYGQPISVIQIIPASDKDGTIEIAFDKATVAFRMVIDQAAPHPVIGLLITGAKVRDDGLSKIAEEFKALPGSAGFEIARIDTAKPEILSSHNGTRQYAIGSTFKLYVLAELSRSIQAGERRWEDVLRIDGKSLPSGVLQNWPHGAPLTLQSLATLMISISDNTATDILVQELGRDKIGDLLRKTGHSNPAKTLPILTTLELFALKMPGNDDLRRRYANANDTAQAKLLRDQQSRLSRNAVAIENLANKPQHIEDIEWFASPADTNKLLAHISAQSDPIAKAIMALGSDVPPGDRARWAYLGSKGGSEPGVISYAFLVTARSGQSYAVSGSWNNPKAPVDGPKFQMLMNRLLNLTAERNN